MSVITALIIILCAAQGVGSPPPRAEMPTATLPPLHLISPPILSRGDVREVATDDREHGVLGYAGSGDPLTEAEMRAVLTAAGWPEELHAEALAVAYCESSWRPGVVGDGGKARGLFQIHASPWFAYAGEDLSAWANPVTNARTAWAVYQYDIARGYVPWQQWACRRVL